MGFNLHSYVPDLRTLYYNFIDYFHQNDGYNKASANSSRNAYFSTEHTTCLAIYKTTGLQFMYGFHVRCPLQSPLLDMIPPAHEEVVHHQPEPRGQLNAIFPGISFPEQLLQLIAVHVFDVSHLFRIRVELHVMNHEQEVIH